MSNIVDLPPNDKSGLYKAPSHAEGGVRVIVDGTKAVEVEGHEFHLCRAVLQSDKIYEFKNKTNKQILETIFQDSNCIFEQGRAAFGDFIICKLVVLDESKRDMYGSAKDIINVLQSEKSCNVTEDANLPSEGNKHEKGGGLKEDVFIAPKGTIIAKTPSHRAKHKLSKLGIPFLSLYSIGWGGNEWYSLIYDKDAPKLKSIKGSSTQNKIKGIIASRRNNDALEKIFKEQKENLENETKKEKPVTKNKDDKSEIKDMIDLLEMTVKANPKDTESNDMLDLLKRTLSDNGVSKKDEGESTLIKIYHKLESDDFGFGYLKSVWSNHTPPTVIKNEVLDKYKKLVKELSNDKLQELLDKKQILTEDEYKKHNGDKEFIVKYVAKERMNLKPKMQGQTKTYIVAKDRSEVEKILKNKKEFPDFGKLISIKPSGEKYLFKSGGYMDTNVAIKEMVAVHNTDLSGLMFANKRGAFIYPSVELIDVNDYSNAKLSLSVLLFFSNKQYRTPDYIQIDEVIGAVIPSNMDDAKLILSKHGIPFTTYELNVTNINDSKINAVKELSKTHNNIFVEND